MTYTLTMAADQEVRIADDGVREVPMTKARALLTRVIRETREGIITSAFIERGERKAYVVTPEYRDQAEADRQLVAALRETDPALYERLAKT